MRDATVSTTCSDVATKTPAMCTGIASLPRRAIEREAARQPQDRRRQRSPRIPVAKIEREQQSERRRLVGERRDEIERRERREEPERRRDAEDRHGTEQTSAESGAWPHYPPDRDRRSSADAIRHHRSSHAATHCASAEAKSVPDAWTSGFCGGFPAIYARRSRDEIQRRWRNQPRGRSVHLFGFSSRNPSGGTVRLSEYAWPCDGSIAACRPRPGCRCCCRRRPRRRC